MRGFMLGCIAVYCLALFSAYTAYADDIARIGVVDLRRVFEDSGAGRHYRSELKSFRSNCSDWLKELKIDVAEAEKKNDNQMAELTMVAHEKLEKRCAAVARERDYRYLKRVHDDIAKLAKEMGKAEGYLIIYEKNPNILYRSGTIDDRLDVSDKLIEYYDAYLPGNTLTFDPFHVWRLKE